MILEDKILPSREIRVRAEELETLYLVLARKQASLHDPDSSSGSEVRLIWPSRKPRDFYILWLLRDSLPIMIRTEVEAHYKEIPKLPLEERRNILKLKDRIFLDNDLNYLNGRILTRALWMLKFARIYLCKLRRPKRTQRHRGYRDHGTMPKFDAGARREANSSPNLSKALEKEYLIRQQEDLELASQILRREREGVKIQDNVRATATERKEFRSDSEDRPFQDLTDEALNRSISWKRRLMEQEIEKDLDLIKTLILQDLMDSDS